VLGAHFAAVAAGDQRRGGEGIVGAAAIAAALGMLAFRMRRHAARSFCVGFDGTKHNNACRDRRQAVITGEL
jgi:hypothetical protein